MLEIADYVVEKGLPLLFLDTCVLLDVIRAPFRHDEPKDAIATISRAVQLVERNDEFMLAVSSIVPEEFHANFSTVVRELAKHCQLLIGGITMINGLFATFGLPPHPPIPDGSMLELESCLEGLANQLLANALKLDQEDAVKLKAFDRLAARTPPGHRGDQHKDCLIFEEFLELARHVRERNHPGRIVFCTSNTQDYCKFRSNAFPEIASELDSVNVKFTTKLPWAFAELNLR